MTAADFNKSVQVNIDRLISSAQASRLDAMRNRARLYVADQLQEAAAIADSMRPTPFKPGDIDGCYTCAAYWMVVSLDPAWNEAIENIIYPMFEPELD